MLDLRGASLQHDRPGLRPASLASTGDHNPVGSRRNSSGPPLPANRFGYPEWAFGDWSEMADTWFCVPQGQPRSDERSHNERLSDG